MFSTFVFPAGGFDGIPVPVWRDGPVSLPLNSSRERLPVSRSGTLMTPFISFGGSSI